MKIDLHLHTVFSDGGKTVQEIFDIAHNNNVQILSITDHNNIDAYGKLTNIDRHGIKVVQGIEIDARFEKVCIHIVVYAFEIGKEMHKYLQKARAYDIKEFKRMLKDCEKINNISFDKHVVKSFINNNQYFDKVRLNNLIVESTFAKTPVEAFYNFTKSVEDKKRYILNAKKLFKIAKKNGGQTFIAHPLKYIKTFETIENLEHFILKLQKIGLDGVEVYNNRQDKHQEKAFLSFAKNNNLKISGGSDFHAKIGAKESKSIGNVLDSEINKKSVSKDLFDKFI